MEKLRISGQFAIAFGLVYLASALVYFSVEAGKIRSQVPLIVASFEAAENGDDGHPLLARVDRALIELPRMTSAVEAIQVQIPQMLEESAAIRTLVPEVLVEVKEVREAMGPILAESAALRAELPGIIKGAKGVSKSVGAGAAQGTMEGTVKGIVSAPFEVLKQGADLITPGNSNDKPKGSPQDE